VTHDGPRDHRLILSSVGRRCVQELGVDSATIAVATGSGAWMPAYASADNAEQLEQYAFTVGEGPCFDTLRDHVPVVIGDLAVPAALRRWPVWARKARELDVRSVAAFPIQAGAISAGVLTVYSAALGQLNSEQLVTARRLADIAFLGLLDIMAGLDDPQMNEADVSLLLRAEVHRAAGMVMAQAGVSIEDALVRLRAYAFSSGQSLNEIATEVVARRLRFDPEQRSAR
jgi:GAF domain-containing protein/ANTAR domain-containing protein